MTASDERTGASARRNGTWTGDDILSTAAETYALLPRSSAGTTAAFTTLLQEYWPNASAGTRLEVAQALRSSRRVSPKVIDALDRCEAGLDADAPLEASEPTNEAAGTPAADHARETMRELSKTGDPGPEIQRREIARRLRDTTTPARDLAELLKLPASGADQVLGDPRGVIVALKALGVPCEAARGFVSRWHATVPPGFEAAFEALTLSECHDVVAAWRGAALLQERRAATELRRSA